MISHHERLQKRMTWTLNAFFQAVMRFYTERGYACLPEFTLKTNRRPDITCLHKDGTILMVEVKSSVNDFKTDKKMA